MRKKGQTVNFERPFACRDWLCWTKIQPTQPLTYVLKILEMGT